MPVWDVFVGLLGALLLMLAQSFGGNLGLAIMTLSFVARVALLPLTMRLARRAQARQVILLALEPKIRELRLKYQSDPQRFHAELLKLYRRHGYSPMDSGGFLGGLAQLPIVVGLYSAISRGLGEAGGFLWISNLARPDPILTLLIGALTYLVSIISPDLPQQSRILVSLIPALATVYFVWNLASGIGLYWVTSAAVGVLQVALVRRNST